MTGVSFTLLDGWLHGRFYIERGLGDSGDFPSMCLFLLLKICLYNLVKSMHDQVFKLLSKQLVTTPKSKPVHMPEDVIQVVNDMGEQDDMPNGIQFCNTYHESTLADLFADNDLHDDNSCASDNDWGLNKKPEEDLKKITFDNHVDGN